MVVAKWTGQKREIEGWTQFDMSIWDDGWVVEWQAFDKIEYFRLLGFGLQFFYRAHKNFEATSTIISFVSGFDGSLQFQALHERQPENGKKMETPTSSCWG